MESDDVLRLEKNKIKERLLKLIETEKQNCVKRMLDSIPIETLQQLHDTSSVFFEKAMDVIRSGIFFAFGMEKKQSNTSSETTDIRAKLSDTLTEAVSKYFNCIESSIKELEWEPRKIRIYLVGHSGSCKSSLINAIVGNEAAKVGTIHPTSSGAREHDIPDVNAIFVDTRGISEGGGIEVDSISAEDQLLEEVKKNPPDVVLYCITKSYFRTNGTNTTPFLKKLKDTIGQDLPILLVLTKIDDNLGVDVDPNDKEEVMKSALEMIPKMVENIGFHFHATLACSTKQYKNKTTGQLNFSLVMGVGEIRDAINTHSSISAQLKILNDSVLLGIKRGLTSKLVNASMALTAVVAPIPFVEAYLVIIIRELMIKFLSAVLETEDRTYADFKKDNQIFLGLSFAANLIQSGAAIILDICAPVTFGLGYLISTATSATIQPGLTYALGWKAFEYFTRSPAVDHNVVSKFENIK